MSRMVFLDLAKRKFSEGTFIHEGRVFSTNFVKNFRSRVVSSFAGNMPSAGEARAATQGQEEQQKADSQEAQSSKGILAQLHTELHHGPAPGDPAEEEAVRRALLESLDPFAVSPTAGSPTAVGDGDTAGSHADGRAVAGPAPADAEDSAPAHKLRKVLGWRHAATAAAARQRFLTSHHLRSSASSSNSSLQAQAPQQCQQQQQQPPPGKGAHSATGNPLYKGILPPRPSLGIPSGRRRWPGVVPETPPFPTPSPAAETARAGVPAGAPAAAAPAVGVPPVPAGPPPPAAAAAPAAAPPAPLEEA